VLICKITGKNNLIYLDDKASIFKKNVIQNGWGLCKKMFHVETTNNNVNAGLQSMCSIILVKEHIFSNNVPYTLR
jgi:hypothetical protein